MGTARLSPDPGPIRWMAFLDAMVVGPRRSRPSRGSHNRQRWAATIGLSTADPRAWPRPRANLHVILRQLECGITSASPTATKRSRATVAVKPCAVLRTAGYRFDQYPGIDPSSRVVVAQKAAPSSDRAPADRATLRATLRPWIFRSPSSHSWTLPK